MNREIELQELTAKVKAEKERIYSSMAEADMHRAKQIGYVANETAQRLHAVTDENTRHNIIADGKAKRADVAFEYATEIAAQKNKLAALQDFYAQNIKAINDRWRDEQNNKSNNENN